MTKGGPAAGFAQALVVVLLLAVVVGACSASTSDGSGKLRVVTTVYPIEFAARRVGGALVDVVNLTPPGGEPHDLELKPSDLVTIKDAELVFSLGAGFQPAVDDALETVSDDAKVDVLEGMPLRPAAGDERELTADPHVWLSPVLMQKLVDTVAEAFADRLPGRAGDFRAGAGSLNRGLAALDEEFRTTLASCARREVFTSHEAFGYLTDRYGLRQIAIEGLTPESEPSSQRLQEIARQAEQAKATTIFFETLVSPRVAEAVARIAGAKTAVLDPIEGLSPEARAAGADYFSVMRANLAALDEALGCAA